MQNDGVRDLIRDYEVGRDVIDVSSFATSMSDLEIVNLVRKDGSVSWVAINDSGGIGEMLVRYGNAPLDASALTGDYFIFADAPIEEPSLDQNTILDTVSGSRDDLRATEMADTFIMLDDGEADLIRDLDVGVDLIDVSSFAASFADLQVTNVLRSNGTTSWIEIADSSGEREILVRFDADTVLDAASLTQDSFIF